MPLDAAAIVDYDPAFYEQLPKLFAHTDARSWLAGQSDDHIRGNALRGGTLQGANAMIPVRARFRLRSDGRIRQRQSRRRLHCGRKKGSRTYSSTSITVIRPGFARAIGG